LRILRSFETALSLSCSTIKGPNRLVHEPHQKLNIREFQSISNISCIILNLKARTGTELRKVLLVGEKKPEVEDVLGRIDELIRILKFLSRDLGDISKSLRELLNIPTEGQPTQPLRPPTSAQQTISFEEPTAPSAATVSGGARTVEDVQRVFPQDLAGMLYFEVTDDHVLIKPRQYLGSDNFRRIAAIVRDQLGGEYVSAGKDSHFRIPKKP
jgi:hypothetical protein